MKSKFRKGEEERRVGISNGVPMGASVPPSWKQPFTQNAPLPPSSETISTPPSPSNQRLSWEESGGFEKQTEADSLRWRKRGLWVPGYSPVVAASFTIEWFSFLEASVKSKREDYKKVRSVQWVPTPLTPSELSRLPGTHFSTTHCTHTEERQTQKAQDRPYSASEWLPEKRLHSSADGHWVISTLGLLWILLLYEHSHTSFCVNTLFFFSWVYILTVGTFLLVRL